MLKMDTFVDENVASVGVNDHWLLDNSNPGWRKTLVGFTKLT